MAVHDFPGVGDHPIYDDKNILAPTSKKDITNDLEKKKVLDHDAHHDRNKIDPLLPEQRSEIEGNGSDRSDVPPNDGHVPSEGPAHEENEHQEQPSPGSMPDAPGSSNGSSQDVEEAPKKRVKKKVSGELGKIAPHMHSGPGEDKDQFLGKKSSLRSGKKKQV